MRTEDNKLAMPRADEYALGYAVLKRLTEKGLATYHRFLLTGGFTVQPAGLPEQRALEEVERELKVLGVVHR